MGNMPQMHGATGNMPQAHGAMGNTTQVHGAMASAGCNGKHAAGAGSMVQVQENAL